MQRALPFFLASVACCKATTIVAPPASLLDPDTTETTITRYTDSKKLHLVMSDEFTTPGRSFAKGDDKNFEALH